MCRIANVVRWLLGGLIFGFVSALLVYDVIYFQPRLGAIERMVNDSTEDEKHPGLTLVSILKVSTDGDFCRNATRIISGSMDFDNFRRGVLGRHVSMEIWYWLLRLHLSNEECRTIYLSKSYMGQEEGKEIRGFSASSLHLFNKPLSALSEIEVATVAAVPKAPAWLLAEPERLKMRRDHLLSKAAGGPNN